MPARAATSEYSRDIDRTFGGRGSTGAGVQLRTPLDILLVEDDEGDAFLVLDGLSAAAPTMTVHRATTLAEALRMAGEEIACVLLDLGLPDTDGLDGLRSLRERASHVAVVVLTGRDDQQLGIEALGAGAQDYLVKGQVGPEVLARAIRYAVERRRAERSEQALLEAQLQANENARLERGLLPTALIRDPGLRIVSDYRPGNQRALLGGDFYDAVELPDGTLHAMIGDVCGHGADEAALGASLRIAWRALTLAGHSPEEVIATLNEMLPYERHKPDIFATLSMLSVHPDRGGARVHLAGHPPPILLNGDSVRALEVPPASPPLGLFDCADRTAAEVDLDGEWSLLLYTDGLIEGRIGDGSERLGNDRLVAMFERHTRERPGWRGNERELLDGVIAEVEQLNGAPLTDDLAVVLVSAVHG
jgi:serine phosphatase RsbU (regulator of sigma subunit)